MRTPEILKAIQEEKERILLDCKGAKILLDLADNSRKEKAKEILKAGKISYQVMGDEVKGEVGSSSGETVYGTRFIFKNGRIRSTTCTCPDHTGQCKHVLSVVTRWLLDQRSLWGKLNEAEKILENPTKHKCETP